MRNLFFTNCSCPKCRKPLYLSDVEGYSFVCKNCDENFYSMEASCDSVLFKVYFGATQAMIECCAVFLKVRWFYVVFLISDHDFWWLTRPKKFLFFFGLVWFFRFSNIPWYLKNWQFLICLILMSCWNDLYPNQSLNIR